MKDFCYDHPVGTYILVIVGYGTEGGHVVAVHDGDYYDIWDSGPMNLIQRFKEFKANFQGDPQQQVQNLLNSGQMTQEQFNNLSNMATQFKEMFK